MPFSASASTRIAIETFPSGGLERRPKMVAEYTSPKIVKQGRFCPKKAVPTGIHMRDLGQARWQARSIRARQDSRPKISSVSNMPKPTVLPVTATRRA